MVALLLYPKGQTAEVDVVNRRLRRRSHSSTPEKYSISNLHCCAGPGLRSVKSTHKPNQINSVWATGISDHILLPQLVVCGDQSSGKSSVLEGITGIPFPRQDGVCTRFPIDVILCHDFHESYINATAISHGLRSELDKEQSHSYYRGLSRVFRATKLHIRCGFFL
jgi:hypothetical protein